jgi:hypothetical protein
VQVVGQLGDGQDEDEIEEQLQPGGTPLTFAGGVQGRPPGRQPSAAPLTARRAGTAAKPPGDRPS